MSERTRRMQTIVLLSAILLAWPRPVAHSAAEPRQVRDVPLTNPSFEEGVNDAGVPLGWSPYGGGNPKLSASVIELGPGKGKALFIEDGDPGAEVGVHQTFALTENVTYEASARVKMR